MNAGKFVMARKLRFYLIGLIPGILLVMFILNQKGTKCTGYLPNSRVTAETLTKKFIYADDFKNEMARLNISETFLRDSIITEGQVDFDRSHAQKQPCPDYLLLYPKKNPKLEVTFEKCRETATFSALKMLR